MATFQARAEDMKPIWYQVDATGKTLGRLACEIAKILRGKHKAIYTPHVITGDCVIVTNCEKVKVTGNKLDQKTYYRHSQRPGSLKEVKLRTQLEKHPDRVLLSAIKGMLPRGPLGRRMFENVKVYAGVDHPHNAQKPQILAIKEA